MLHLNQNPHYNESIIHLLVGGTPCQSFSLAGLRAGLDSKNGNLALQYCRILIEKRPRWFIWENVPGVFSSFSNSANGKDLEGEGFGNGQDVTETADFATILTAFSECGYSCAWRVLDSQYFGVAQRRRRVFVVGYLGNDWRPPFAVLFEPESLRGSSTPNKQKRESIAGALRAGAGKSGEPIASTLLSNQKYNHLTTEGAASTLTTSGTKQRVHDNYVVMASGQANAEISTGPSPTLSCLHESPIITGTLSGGAHPGGFNGQDFSSGLYTMQERDQETFVRRLTPLEWERLQGFPDHYTAIKGAKDSPRYKAIGNSMTVHVMKWIGRRIDVVDKVLQTLK